MDSSRDGTPLNGSPVHPESGAANGPDGIAPAGQPDPAISKAVDDVLYSDDFSSFLNKRSKLEEEHAQGLKKLCKATHEANRRSDSREGSYAVQFEEVTRLHERIGDNGMQFALSLHQMHEDLNELSNNMERGRKQWKATGLSNEKKVSDAESQMEKAKAKYDSLAEDYDRARTGDKSAGRVFGIKGPKSAAQHEEDLKRKLDAADSDYQSKVHNAQTLRQELFDKLRPQAVRALMELIKECDSALTLQLQKFAAFNEKLLLGNGILVAPLSDSSAPSLRDLMVKIDNEKDLYLFITSQRSRITAPQEIRYIQHPTLAPHPSAAHVPAMGQQPSQPSGFQHTPAAQTPVTPQAQPQAQQTFLDYNPSSQLDDNPRQAPFTSPPPQSSSAYQTPPYPTGPNDYSSAAPPAPAHNNAFGPPAPAPSLPDPHAPPIKPVFGLSLEELFRRDANPVPMVVYQCIQAVDLFGLDQEGIYRIPGTNSHIQAMKAMFDHNPDSVDFRNPSAFFHDVNSVAGLLKQFFRDLPDPLLTHEHYAEFIEAARIDDDTVRRDSLHAIINALPDPNYATLRALVLHLNRVQERSAMNRMSGSNVAICFAPSMMGQHRGQIADSGLQAKVVDTILQNTYQIFDED
ncbi:RhoGAP-domain-containing protein [Saccharata proteae CBS 121410]|uniref:RhoGAP-domain-containing protein n=1 Tax=Saccharata proteae CBS 121410 TaxID=1314787 RepID=A0A9P4HYB6_9PEZI|nr:RhoGAP-domain-containing protein [Saccharata proteae CBS 121410]